MGELNIAPNTQIGRIEIDNVVYKGENPYHIEESKYSRGGEFIENMVTDNIIEYCHRWFHLANINELLEDIDEYYMKTTNFSYSNLLSAGFDNGIYSPIMPTSKEVKSPVSFNNYKKPTSPVKFYTRRNPDYTYDKLNKEN